MQAGYLINVMCNFIQRHGLYLKKVCDNTWDPTGMRHGTVILPGYAERGDAGGPCKEPYSVGQVVYNFVLSF